MFAERQHFANCGNLYSVFFYILKKFFAAIRESIKAINDAYNSYKPAEIKKFW